MTSYTSSGVLSYSNPCVPPTSSIDIILAHRSSSSPITSSAGSDYGELLPDLWQTTSLSSSLSGTSLSTNFGDDIDYFDSTWSTYELSLLPNTLYDDLDNIDFFPPVAEVSNITEARKSSIPPKHRRRHDKVLPVNTQLYKTEMCASYLKMGVCPYGSKCQFAHGENELKFVERPPKWRLKPCANWTKYGNCRYGNRCCFKHG